MSIDQLESALAVARILHMRNSGLQHTALAEVMREASEASGTADDVRRRREILSEAMCYLGEADADAGDLSGLDRMQRVAEAASAAGDPYRAAESFSSMLGVLLRCNLPYRAVAMARCAAECFARAGDVARAQRAVDFSEHWLMKIEQWPDEDWGAWVRSG